MPIKGIVQPGVIEISGSIRLKKYDKSQWSAALCWYQNPTVVYYSDGENASIYDSEKLSRMYSYLEDLGELYFIEINENNLWKPIGDVTLSEENTPIVIGEETYWGRHIGRQVMKAIVNRAKSINLTSLEVIIYNYNERSKRLFSSLGFIKIFEDKKEGKYKLKLNDSGF